MTPVDQTILHDPETGAIGNCMQAAIASLLDLPLDDVPHFVKLYPESEQCGQAISDWCLDRRYFVVQLDLEQLPDQMLCMLHGTSPRGLPHVVVGRGTEMIHDPHPSRDGLTETWLAWILCPFLPEEPVDRSESSN